MLRKLAVALLAASVFTVPALAQGTAAKTTDKPAAATTMAPKVAAKPTLKSAKARKHHRHVAHVRKNAHAEYVKTDRSVHGAKHHAHRTVSKPAGEKAAMSTTKPKSGTN